MMLILEKTREFPIFCSTESRAGETGYIGGSGNKMSLKKDVEGCQKKVV